MKGPEFNFPENCVLQIVKLLLLVNPTGLPFAKRVESFKITLIHPSIF